MTFPQDPALWLGACSYSDAGTVLHMEIAGSDLTGAVIRQALALRSAAFSAAYDAEQRQFVITVHGYGHSVGMSQYGAHKMAHAGASCEEILLHYCGSSDVPRGTLQRGTLDFRESTRILCRCFTVLLHNDQMFFFPFDLIPDDLCDVRTELFCSSVEPFCFLGVILALHREQLSADFQERDRHFA